MRLAWSRFAQEDRDEIFDYILKDSPRTAVAVDEAIAHHVAMLARFPEQGRPGRIDGTRELPITKTPYLAAYRIVGDTVIILRLLHGARQWPDDLPDEPELQPESG